MTTITNERVMFSRGDVLSKLEESSQALDKVKSSGVRRSGYKSTKYILADNNITTIYAQPH